MEIVTDLSGSMPPAGGSAVTIGAYDGVHLGHQALLAELGRRARAGGLTTAVVTFDRHPASVVRPETAPRLLCDLDVGGRPTAKLLGKRDRPARASVRAQNRLAPAARHRTRHVPGSDETDLHLKEIYPAQRVCPELRPRLRVRTG